MAGYVGGKWLIMYAIKQLGWHFIISHLSIVERIVAKESWPRLLQLVVTIIGGLATAWMAARMSLSKDNRFFALSYSQWQGDRGPG